MNLRNTRSNTINHIDKENQSIGKRTNVTTRKVGAIIGENISNKRANLSDKTPIIQVKKPVLQPRSSPGLDNSNNPQDCKEYVKEIMDYFRSNETKYLIKSDFLSAQVDIHSGMRQTLVDWLVDVHLKFELGHETYWLTFNLLDRYLSKEQVVRTKLQLVGVVCMWIAAKYEEIYVPEVREFVDICAGTYSKDEMLKTEESILTALEFNLTVATPWLFLKRFASVTRCDMDTENMGLYILEKTLMDTKLITMRPSKLAAACLCLARIKQLEPWTFELAYYSGFSEDDLTGCVEYLKESVKLGTKYQAVDKKYSSSKRGGVSKHL